MNARKRIALGVSSTALVLGAGAGIATGASSGSGGGPAGGGGPPGAAAISSYLGLTADELRTDLQSGKTLAQLATAQGKTVSGLEDAIVAGAKTNLDAAVAAGTLTAAQEATKLADLQSHVADIVNSTGPPAGGHGRPGRPGRRAGDEGDRRLPRPDERSDPHAAPEREDARPGRDGPGEDG